MPEQNPGGRGETVPAGLFIRTENVPHVSRTFTKTCSGSTALFGVAGRAGPASMKPLTRLVDERFDAQPRRDGAGS